MSAAFPQDQPNNIPVNDKVYMEVNMNMNMGWVRSVAFTKDAATET